MKPAQLGSLNADLAPIEEDLAMRIGAIFERCPQLSGFTVQDSSALPGSCARSPWSASWW